jgi:hypothetical protein
MSFHAFHVLHPTSPIPRRSTNLSHLMKSLVVALALTLPTFGAFETWTNKDGKAAKSAIQPISNTLTIFA